MGKDCWCGSLLDDAGDFFSKVAIDELDDEKLLDFDDGVRMICRMRCLRLGFNWKLRDLHNLQRDSRKLNLARLSISEVVYTTDNDV